MDARPVPVAEQIIFPQPAPLPATLSQTNFPNCRDFLWIANVLLAFN
jgi:hypothetical protein